VAARAGVRGGRQGAGQQAPARHAAARLPEHDRAALGADLFGDRGGHSGRDRAVVPGAGRAAAYAFLGKYLADRCRVHATGALVVALSRVVDLRDRAWDQLAWGWVEGCSGSSGEGLAGVTEADPTWRRFYAGDLASLVSTKSHQMGCSVLMPHDWTHCASS